MADTKSITPITPQFKLVGENWRDIPTAVTEISFSIEENVQVYNPINCITPTIIRMTASPSFTWEITGVCTSSTDLHTIDASFRAGKQASFKCSTATPGVPVFIENLSWEETGKETGVYRFNMTLRKIDEAT